MRPVNRVCNDSTTEIRVAWLTCLKKIKKPHTKIIYCGFQFAHGSRLSTIVRSDSICFNEMDG